MTNVGNTADCVVSDAVGGSAVFENNKATVVVLGNGGVDDNEAAVVFENNKATVVVLGNGGVDDNEATVVFGSGVVDDNRL